MLALVLMVSLVGCSSSKTNDGEKTPESESTNYDFYESNGSIKYLTIKGDKKVPIAKTLGEYYYYLEQCSSRIEFGDIGRIKSLDDVLNPGETTSNVEYLKVYFDDDDTYQWMGVQFENNTNKKIKAKNATIKKLTLKYEETGGDPSYCAVDYIGMNLGDDEIVLDGKSKLVDFSKVVGEPYKTIDGKYFYDGGNGFEYILYGATKYGYIYTVEINYPKQ